MHIDACGAQKLSEPLELEVQVAVGHLMWVLGTEPGPLEEQQVRVTAEPPLQSLLSLSLHCGSDIASCVELLPDFTARGALTTES